MTSIERSQIDRVNDVRTVLESFVRELDDTINDTQKIERILRGDEHLTRNDLSAEPEEWTEDALIGKLITALGLNIQPGRPNPRYETPEWVDVEIPDFELQEKDNQGENGDLWIIGENKSVNKFDEAEVDIQEYLGKMWWPDYGIATDGIKWGVYHIEASSGDGSNGDIAQNYRSFSEHIDLRNTIRSIAVQEGVVGQRQLNGGDIDGEIESFVDLFAPDNLVDVLRRRAPKQLRDERKSDVDAFYELYIELLFGESDEYDEKYESTLRNDIIQPDGLPEKDADIFAVELVNRLLFIKFLEERDVLNDNFLLTRIKAYDKGLPQTLYKSVFDPVFHELLNTKMDDRPQHQQTGWKGDVPFLNGGLFRETVECERQYDVLNNTLETVIRDLAEGTELDFEIDPAILGSVFEKTINHLSEKEDRQKELGAFYTPDDVTRLISEQSIQQKVRDEIIDVWADHVSQEVEFRDSVEEMEYEEILSKIEAGASWFGRPDALEAALERVQGLRILDPACGSGHFLTAALDELHQAQLSLLRGTHGDNLTNKDRYDAKRQLVLGTIYGVDVDPIAVQIARLRTWLTIVEGGWNDSYDELPNIEVNIVDGNSLIGLPAEQSGQTTADVWDDRLDTLITLRRAYKGEADIPEDVIDDLEEIDADSSDEVTKEDIEDVLDQVRPEFNEQYIKRLDHSFDGRITTRTEFELLIEDIDGDTLYPTLQSIRIKRDDEEAFKTEQKEQLGDIGCTVHTKSARLYVESRHKELTSDDETLNPDARAEIVSDLKSVLDDGYIFDEVERQAVIGDLEHITGDPFHWAAEFPEAAVSDGASMSYDVAFDVILGNPPYGDVLNGIEKNLVAKYETGGVSDIAAQFVERQFDLLDENGYYGNILSLRLAYDKSEAPVRNLLYEQLSDGQLACFAHRPSRVFEDAHVKPGIITGQKDVVEEDSEESEENGESTDTPHSIESSRFIRFDESNRNDRLSDIEYAATDGLVLGEDYIGSGENYSIPKLGSDTARNIIEKLKSQSVITQENRNSEDADSEGSTDSDDDEDDETEIINTIGTRLVEDRETDHLMWRRRGSLYWINPMLTNLYENKDKDTPTSMYKMYFNSDLERRCAFLILQSSLYYHYWMVYKNGRNIDWWEIRPFPFPDDETLEEHADKIGSLSTELWKEMEDRFVGAARTVFEDSAELKPVVDRVDDLLGEMYGLTDEEIDHLKQFDAEYGRTA